MARVRYFAAAEEFAGVAEEVRSERDVAALRRALSMEHPRLGPLLPRCALLLDGRRVDDQAPLSEASLVDVLPPFAGG